MDRDELVLSQLTVLPKIAERYLGQGLDLDDLVQEGTLGFFRAAEKFNSELGEFQVYSWSWVNQFMQRAVDNTSRTVRIPVWALEKARRENTLVGPLVLELSTIEGIASDFDPVEIVSDLMLFKVIRSIVANLPERDKDIAIRRYGFGGNETETLQEIGSAWSLTRARIGQLDKALREHIRSALAEFDYVGGTA